MADGSEVTSNESPIPPSPISPIQKTNTNPISPLLSLPPELRTAIWEEAISDLPILIFEKRQRSIYPKLGAIRLSPTWLSEKCMNYTSQRHGLMAWDIRAGTVPSIIPPASQSSTAPGTLTWIHTNRQIYQEAMPLVSANVVIHFCGGAGHFVEILRLGIPKHPSLLPGFESEKLRTLSFCMKMGIKSDLEGGFVFDMDQKHGWATGHGEGCGCDLCGYSRVAPEGVSVRFPGLREVHLRIEFLCKHGQGDTRRNVGSPTPLECSNSSEAIAAFSESFARPLRLLVIGREQETKVRHVKVHFRTEEIGHGFMVDCTQHRIRCWCAKGWTVNEESLKKVGIAREIGDQLISRHFE